jgi:hypothetical protein
MPYWMAFCNYLMFLTALQYELREEMFEIAMLLLDGQILEYRILSDR